MNTCWKCGAVTEDGSVECSRCHSGDLDELLKTLSDNGNRLLATMLSHGYISVTLQARIAGLQKQMDQLMAKFERPKDGSDYQI